MDELELIFGISPAPEKAAEAPAVTQAAVDSPPIIQDGVELVPDATPMLRLASWVMNRFYDNANARRESGVDERLNYYLRAQTCQFSKEQQEKLSKVLPLETAKHIFAPITSTKNRAAKAMLVDLANQSGEPLFHIEPSPSPDTPSEVAEMALQNIMQGLQNVFAQFQAQGVTELPPEVMQQVQQLAVNAVSTRYDEIANAKEGFARSRAQRIEKKVWDTMLEGGFNDAFYDFIDNACLYGTGVIIGPVLRVVPSNKCIEKKDKDGKYTGVRQYKRVFEKKVVFESVNPQDCYPSPDAKAVGDGALCIRVRYSAETLWQYSDATSDGVEDGGGWIVGVVRNILARHRENGVKLYIEQYSPERRFCERNGYEDSKDSSFEGIRCFASVRGADLIELGILRDRKRKAIRANSFYKTETIVIDNRVVYCRIYDDALELPVSKGVFYHLPGSWWGEAIADKVAMTQCVLNNAIKALMANMPASSGGIFWINDVQRMANKGVDAYRLKAGMTVPFNTSMIGNTGAPIGVLSVPSNASELLAVWAKMQTQADYDSGIPSYTEGQSAGSSGALRTAQGLAMFTEASSRGMKMIMTSIDRDIISHIARMTADWILLNDDDQELKGDVNVRPVGLIGKILKAQRDQQRLQLFNMVVSNQMLTQIVGANGIVELLRPSISDIDINPDDVLPSKGKLEEMEIVSKIKQIFEATSAAQGVQQNAAPPEGAEQGGGAPPGVSQPPAVQGGVAERRGVA